MARWLVLLGIALLSLGSAAHAETGLCAETAAFAKSRFDGTEKPKGRRWVELHWRGAWLDIDGGWGLSCRHSEDAASARFCDWLVHHSSFEFRSRTPQGILSCYGYAFPLSAQHSWGDWKSNVSILTPKLQFLLLEIRFDDAWKESGAIRLSAFAHDESPATVEMPRMKPMPPLSKSEPQ